MSDSTGDSGIAFVRVQQRSNPDVQTYEAVPRVELAARLAEAVDGTAVESCDIVLPIPSVARLTADLETWLQRVTTGAVTIGTVVGGVWITGPLAGHDGPRRFEWYG
jgi:hypothetical protein